MSKTTNYGLFLYDDDTKFAEWREKMDGSNDSNMVKIDNALAEKAIHSKTVTTTLYASKWSGLDSPYTQEISVDGLGAVQNGQISCAHGATFEQRQAAREAELAVTGQSEGKLVIAADGEMPELDIPVVIILLD